METEQYKTLNETLERIKHGMSTAADAEVLRGVINDLRRERNLLRHRANRLEDTVLRDNAALRQSADQLESMMLPPYVYGDDDGYSR